MIRELFIFLNQQLISHSHQCHIMCFTQTVFIPLANTFLIQMKFLDKITT